MVDSKLLYGLSSAFPAKPGKYNVLVAHPGTQHSQQTALALQKAGMLHQYVTGFYFKTSGPLANLIQLLPLKYGKKLERQLLRRRNDDLDQNMIRTFPLPELIYVLSARLKFTKKWSDYVIRWKNRRFDKYVAKLVMTTRPDAVICYDSCALNTFKACKETGSIAILDQSIGLLEYGIKILREEAELHPEFADTLSINVPEWLVAQCAEEALAADRVLVASEYVRNTLIENGVSQSRIVTIPYGVDVNRFYPTAKFDDGTFRIMFVGGISQRKGIKYLLEAFKQLNLPGAELVLVGGNMGGGNGLKPYSGYFRHVPNAPYREVHTLFQSADIFVYPSLHEGSALAIYEALACGLPVITTTNSGSVVRDGVDGFIVPIRDIEALKEKILLLYKNKDIRIQMSLQARKRAESFTWLAYHQRLGSIVQNLIQENKLYLINRSLETVARNPMNQSWVHADLPRAGLGNKLLVWARALIFSHLNDLPLYVSNWAELKIGPLLRNEKSKRQYWGYFVKNNQPSILKRLEFLMSKHIEDPPLGRVGEAEEKLLYTFQSMPSWPDYFKDLREFRALIVSRFFQNVSPKYLSLAQRQEGPVIGVHVRRSDFSEPVAGEEMGNTSNQRISLDYYIRTIQAIRDIHGTQLPVTVFTDGKEYEVAGLLALPYVKIAVMNPDIVDLILLSRSRYIVVSPGSTFSYWAAFISNAPVITHSSFKMKIRSDEEKLFEGPVEAFGRFL